MGRIQKRDEYAGLINLIMEIIKNKDLHDFTFYSKGKEIGKVVVGDLGDNIISIYATISWSDNSSMYVSTPISLCINLHKIGEILINKSNYNGWYDVTKRALLNHIEK